MSRLSTPRAPPSFAALVQSFFTEHLTQQRAMSPRTVATYRDGFVLFEPRRVSRRPVGLSQTDVI